MSKKFQIYKMPKESVSYDDLPNLAQTKQKAKDKYQTQLEYFGVSPYKLKSKKVRI